MTDYKDWREESLYKDKEYIQEYIEYTPEKLAKIFSALIDKAVAAGLQNCFIRFETDEKPYKGYLGQIAVVACGYREATQEEKQRYLEEDEVRNLANDMGITDYEARAVYHLRKAGKL